MSKNLWIYVKTGTGEQGTRGWSCPRCLASSWDRLPSEGACLGIPRPEEPGRATIIQERIQEFFATAKQKQVYLERSTSHRQNYVISESERDLKRWGG